MVSKFKWLHTQEAHRCWECLGWRRLQRQDKDDFRRRCWRPSAPAQLKHWLVPGRHKNTRSWLLVCALFTHSWQLSRKEGEHRHVDVKGPVVLGNTVQEVIRHGTGREVTPDGDRVLQDYKIDTYLFSWQGLVQKQILNNFSKKHAGLYSEWT